MARKKKPEEAPAGSPAWMSTFSDLMNLLLCFFVLLFSMSTVEEEKFEIVIQSFQSSFSILPSGGSSISDGELISSGISALEMFDVYFNSSSALPEGENDVDDTGSETGSTENETGSEFVESEDDEEMTTSDAEEILESAGLAENEEILQEIEEQLEEYGIADSVELEFTEEYVLINLNGALLFESGSAEVREEALPILTKIAFILNNYTDNLIEVEGHTDNVPISGGTYGSNDELSMYRALTVANYIRDNSNVDPGNIKSSGRGEYDPIADNSTPEGRARNRRVEIKIYNSIYSD